MWGAAGARACARKLVAVDGVSEREDACRKWEDGGIGVGRSHCWGGCFGGETMADKARMLTRGTASSSGFWASVAHTS